MERIRDAARVATRAVDEASKANELVQQLGRSSKEALPGTLPVPAFLVQHVPGGMVPSLVRQLGRSGPLEVVAGAPGLVAAPGRLYVAPGGAHMTLSRRGDQVVIEAEDSPPQNACRPSVDVLFRSAAAAYGGDLLAVVLTGMGRDGVDGCRHVRTAGGTVVVQDEHSAVVWGMPGAVAAAGLADRVLPLGAIACRISRMIAGKEDRAVSSRGAAALP